MGMQQLCGSTLDSAEIIVDYKKKKTDIKGVPTDNIKDRLSSAFLGWIQSTGVYVMGVFFLLDLLLKTWNINLVSDYTKQIFTVYLAIITILTSLHFNRKFDFLIKRWMALKTGNKKRNRIRVEDLGTKEFILYDTRNIVVDYEATGDVSKQLSKIWIKQEHPSAVLKKQGNLKDMLLLNNDAVWNVHFLFDGVPSDGSLYIEWI